MAESATQNRTRAGRWGDREASILDAAWTLITAQGFDRMTMADVAAATGLSEGSLYNYVPSKRELAIRVSERWFSAQAETLAEKLASQSSTPGKIRLLIENHMRMILDQPELFLMWIREVRATDAYHSSSSREIFRTYTSLLRNVLKQARLAGEIRGEMSDDMTRDMIYGGAEHIAWTAIVQNRADRLNTSEAAETLGATYWRALKTETSLLEERLARMEEKLNSLQTN